MVVFALRALGVRGSRLEQVVIATFLAGMPPFYIANLVLHGVLWDSWHYGTAPFVPPWYAAICMVADLGMGLYAATQVQAWEGRRSRWSALQASSDGRLPGG